MKKKKMKRLEKRFSYITEFLDELYKLERVDDIDSVVLSKSFHRIVSLNSGYCDIKTRRPLFFGIPYIINDHIADGHKFIMKDSYVTNGQVI